MTTAIKQPGVIKRVLAVIFFGLTLSVIAEWIGMALVWPEQGALHAAQMLQTEIQYLHADFRSVAVTIVQLQVSAYYYAVEYTGIDSALIWLGDSMGFTQYADAALSSIQLFFVRVLILTFSLLSFVLFAFAGVVAGLGLRDLRRYGGGREYGGVYHRAKWLLPKALIAAWIIYLAIPISIHPNAIILPCAALTGLNCLIISSTFKKYL